MRTTATSQINNKINLQNIGRFALRNKSPLLASLSYTSFVASNFMPPLARQVTLGGAVLMGALSIGSLASDLTHKSTTTLNDNFQKLDTTANNNLREVTKAMGGNPVKPIELKEILSEDRRKMSATKPIMDQNTEETWNRITEWVSLQDKPTYNGRQSNYDCLYMYGPPGTGKTVFAKALFGAVDNKYDFKLANITAGDLMERGAEKLNLLKQEVLKQISAAKDTSKPLALGFFLDEVEGSLNKDRSLNAGVVNEYLTFINEIKDAAAHNPNVYILGALATNYDEQVDRASKRDGRVTETLHIDYPVLDVKKQILNMVIDKLDGTLYTDKIKKEIKLAFNKKDSEIQKALGEEYLVGAAIENAVIKTQKDIALMTQKPIDISMKFIELLSKNIITATATATAQRTKDEEELKARQSMATQISRMAQSLEDLHNVANTQTPLTEQIVTALQDLAKNAGDNEQLEKIIKEMGKKFEEMQQQGHNNTQEITEKLGNFIDTIKQYSEAAAQSAKTAQQSATRADQSAKSAKGSETSAERYARNSDTTKINNLMQNVNKTIHQLVDTVNSHLDTKLSKSIFLWYSSY